MKASKRTIRPTRIALIVAAAGLFPFAASAQGTSMSEMQARYKEDIQRCETLTDPEAKRTCRREAGAAMQEARRDRLVRGQPDTSANATARCQRLPMERRADCERLMRDGTAVEHGSVSGGGVLREMTITVPADPAAPAGTYGAPPPTNYQGTTGYQGSAPAAPSTYGTQPVQPAPGYQPAAPAPGYGNPPAQTGGSYTAPSGPYTQPSVPGSYGTQPAR